MLPFSECLREFKRDVCFLLYNMLYAMHCGLHIKLFGPAEITCPFLATL